jgi:IPT/TIG domain
MSRSSIVAKVLPVAIVAAVLGLSFVVRPTTLNATNTALCGFGYGYGYGQLPSVDGVFPNAGIPAGGVTVTLTGCGFTGATAVDFGTTAASTFTVNSDTKITVISPAHAAGTVDITVTTPLGTSPTQPSDQFTYEVSGPCTSVSIVGSPPSPQISDTPITFTASSTGCPNALYAFWLRTTTSPWILIQAYSQTTTYHWDSTGAPTGNVFFGIWAKDASSSATFDKNASIVYAMTVVPCTAATISGSPASPQVSGTPIVFTAGSSSCLKPLFEFWLRTDTTPWQMIQAFSTKNTYNWDSTGAPTGNVFFGVWVKDASSSTSNFDTNASTTYVMSQPACSAVTITAVPSTVVHGSGTHSTITGAASGCTNSTGQLYEFWMRTSTTAWVIVQSYSTTATYDWNSTGAPVGTVFFGVWAKDKKSPTTTFDANASTTVSVT